MLRPASDIRLGLPLPCGFTYSYSQKYFAFLKYINFKEKMLREGIILKYFSYILINITRGTQK